MNRLSFWVRAEIGEKKVVIKYPLLKLEANYEKSCVTYRMVGKRMRGLIGVG